MIFGARDSVRRAAPLPLPLPLPMPLLWLLLLLALALSAPTAARAAPYQYLTYAQLHARLAGLARDHPRELALTTAQDAYGLPVAGACEEHPGEPPDIARPAAPAPCRVWVATLTNHTSLAADRARPEALVSGELHGDEIVGPHAVLAFIEYILDAAARGDEHALRTINTRVVTLLPMANAVGFHRRERGERPDQAAEEPPVDPNRDFAFGQEPDKCMVTIAARAVNELFREHLFRILITFHGGTNALGYEWGDMVHCSGPTCQPAPDTVGMDALAKRMADLAGSAGPYEVRYPTGNMGKLVYPVPGGMEDWAYGASWSPETVVCKPQTFGGYPAEKTTYGNATNRCVTYLVETSSSKAPPENTLGDSDAINSTGGPGDGHVPRNVRLLLAAVDAVEPYIVIDHISSALSASSSMTGTSTGASEDTGAISVSWYVGGAFTVDGTYVEWSVPRSAITKTSEGIGNYGSTPVSPGTAGMFGIGFMPTIFRASIAALPPGSPLYFRIAAVVDSGMTRPFKDAVPNVGVQSHLMGVRSGSQWFFETGDGTRIVQGRAVVYSDTYRAEFMDLAGPARVSTDNSLSWGPNHADLMSYGEDDTAKILTGHVPSGSVSTTTPPRATPAPASLPKSEPENHPGAESNLTMDPRDRNAVVSGIVGVVAIVFVTLVILYKMWKHRENFFRGASDSEFVSANGVDQRELKEPLRQPEGDEDVIVFESSRVSCGAV